MSIENFSFGDADQDVVIEGDSRFQAAANQNRHIRNVVVFCGSRAGVFPIFEAQACKLGGLLATRGYHLVYGSGTVGLMGAVSKAAVAAGGRVTGINTHDFEGSQGTAPDGVREESLPTMFARKARMLQLSQASIVLPGGIGTVDEAGEVLVENDIMHHKKGADIKPGIIKPVIFVNLKVDGIGFYDHFLAQLKMSMKMGFTNATIGRYYTDVPDVDSAVELLDALNRQGPVENKTDRKLLLDPQFAR